MYQGKIIKKIPGDISITAKEEHQGYIDDLSKKSKFELEELLERQTKLVANKAFITKLPDKGEKILNFHHKILQELEHKNEVENAAALLSKLNITSVGKAAMNELEWTGTCTERDFASKVIELDSDDEEDPLKILAQPTGTGVHKKKIIHIQPEECLIKAEDLEEIKSFKSTPTEIEHVKYIVNKVEKSSTCDRKEPFKPFKTTKSNVHDPNKEKERKHNKNWEVTAATPPFIVHGAAKLLNLNESLMLQKQHVEKLQVIQAKHAADKLAEQLGLHNLGPLPENIDKNHRQQNGYTSSSEDEEHEVHDDEDNDTSGTVVYTVDSVIT